jgi:hypothetical protein
MFKTNPNQRLVKALIADEIYYSIHKAIDFHSYKLQLFAIANCAVESDYK